MLENCIVISFLLLALGRLWAAESDWPEQARFVLMNGMCVNRKADSITVGAAPAVTEYRFSAKDVLLGVGDLHAVADGCLSMSMSPLAFCLELQKFVPQVEKPLHHFFTIEPGNFLSQLKLCGVRVKHERLSQ